jgi:hypothetical protein
MTSRWVLVADGANGRDSKTRSSVAAVRALADAGYRVAVTVGGGVSWAAASRYCERTVMVPPVSEPGYAAAIAEELSRNDYVTVLPASDAAVMALEPGAAPLLDKVELGRRVRAAGLPVLRERVFRSPDDMLAGSDDISFPALVKPTIQRGAPMIAGRPEDLERARVYSGEVLVQPFVEAPSRAVCGVVWRGQMLASVHQDHLRLWPRQLGNVCAAVTVEPDLDLEERLLRVLEGHDGIFQAQFIGPYLIDVHPRVYASHPLAIAAGVNLVAVQCALVQGANVPPVRGRAGAFYRWIQGDVCHFAVGIKRHENRFMEAISELRPRAGTAHSMESLRDPRPIAARLTYGAKRLARAGVKGRVRRAPAPNPR